MRLLHRFFHLLRRFNFSLDRKCIIRRLLHWLDFGLRLRHALALVRNDVVRLLLLGNRNRRAHQLRRHRIAFMDAPVIGAAMQVHRVARRENGGHQHPVESHGKKHWLLPFLPLIKQVGSDVCHG
jgi:hypothetical protein